jgi:hypothetical protein
VAVSCRVTVYTKILTRSLAYEYDPETRLLLLVGTHENFYRNLKR